MKGKFVRFCVVFLALAPMAANAQQTELQSYVQQCQTQLGFNASDIPAMNCNDGPRFAFTGMSIVNDFLVHRRVNDAVDVLAACRWGDGDSSLGRPNTKFASLELLIHNRLNQQTCFFAAKDHEDATNDKFKPVQTEIVSPTNFGAFPNANYFWLQPSELDIKTLLSDGNVSNTKPTIVESMRCVNCHVQGAIIASRDIVPYLARFGVINNRHETLVDMGAAQHYHAVGAAGYGKPVITAFQNWDSIIASHLTPPGASCAGSCHSIGGNSPIGNLFIPGNTGSRLLQSIYTDIQELNGCCMAPYKDDSDYRWINLDTAGNGTESENFADAKNPATPPPVPQFLSNCDAPGNMEAHAVGVPIEYSFSTSEMAKIPDRLRAFNVKDGLVCMNSDQEAGQSCHDYSTSYLCNGKWTDPQNTDVPSGDGDHEERSRLTGLCAAPAAIKTHVINGASSADVFGPNDRLARISRFGLNCNNADQPNGLCSNYVVRYRACKGIELGYQGHVSSAWNNNQLTSTGAADNAPVKGQPFTPSWNSQQWELKPVPNTEYVWLRNTATNMYLNVTTQAESALVVTYSLHTDWDSEKWIMERMNGGGDSVRLKNVWSGRYLTLADTSPYSALYSQAFNAGWASQRWKIQ